MKTIEKTMLQMTVACGAIAAGLLINDAALLPSRFTFTAPFLHWQVFLVLGAVVLTTREQIVDFRCRCCGNHEDLSMRALVTSREVLCKSCLAWDPQAAPGRQSAEPEYTALFDALKH